MQEDEAAGKVEQWEWQLIKKGGYVPDPWPMRRKLRTLSSAQQLIGQVIVDKTIGWMDGEGPARKLIDHISVSQFAEATALSERTIYNNLEELMRTGIFIRERSDDLRRSKWRYGINFAWLDKEVALLETGRITKSRAISGEGVDVKGERDAPLEAERDEPDSPLGVNEIHPQKKPSKETQRGKEIPSLSGDGEHTALIKAYLSRLADPHYTRNQKGRFKADCRAAKEILAQGYTPEQILACYDSKKQEPFWADKTLTLVQIKKDIAEWTRHRRMAGGGQGKTRATRSSKISDEVRRQYFPDG